MMRRRIRTKKRGGDCWLYWGDGALYCWFFCNAGALCCGCFVLRVLLAGFIVVRGGWGDRSQFGGYAEYVVLGSTKPGEAAKLRPVPFHGQCNDEANHHSPRIKESPSSEKPTPSKKTHRQNPPKESPPSAFPQKKPVPSEYALRDASYRADEGLQCANHGI